MPLFRRFTSTSEVIGQLDDQWQSVALDEHGRTLEHSAHPDIVDGSNQLYRIARPRADDFPVALSALFTSSYDDEGRQTVTCHAYGGDIHKYGMHGWSFARSEGQVVEEHLLAGAAGRVMQGDALLRERMALPPDRPVGYFHTYREGYARASGVAAGVLARIFKPRYDQYKPILPQHFYVPGHKHTDARDLQKAFGELSEGVTVHGLIENISGRSTAFFEGMRLEVDRRARFAEAMNYLIMDRLSRLSMHKTTHMDGEIVLTDPHGTLHAHRADRWTAADWARSEETYTTPTLSRDLAVHATSDSLNDVEAYLLAIETAKSRMPPVASMQAFGGHMLTLVNDRGRVHAELGPQSIPESSVVS